MKTWLLPIQQKKFFLVDCRVFQLCDKSLWMMNIFISNYPNNLDKWAMYAVLTAGLTFFSTRVSKDVVYIPSFVTLTIFFVFVIDDISWYNHCNLQRQISSNRHLASRSRALSLDIISKHVFSTMYNRVTKVLKFYQYVRYIESSPTCAYVIASLLRMSQLQIEK